MKIRISGMIGIIIASAGLLALLSPDVMQEIQYVQTEAFIDAYEERCRGSDRMDNVRGKTEDPVYQSIMEYNQAIYENGQNTFSDPWFYETSPVYAEGFEDSVYGYIEIPALGQKFKLYIGATKENMSRGTAIMGQTSIPVGGVNTNAVIAGHRGYNQNKMFFKNIEDIQIGSLIYITNPWETLTYRVEGVDIISPYDGDAIKIQPGKDMVTLLTCHPYGSHGQYRYLVYCVRDEEETAETAENRDDDVRTDTMTASDGNTYVLSGKSILREIRFRRMCVLAVFCILVWSVIRYLTNRNI